MLCFTTLEMHRLSRRWLAALVIGPLTACSPCFGVERCEGSAHVAVNGRILDPRSGVAGTGVAVAMSLDNTPVDSTTTDASGIFQVSADEAANSRPRVSLTIRAAGLPGYTIDSVGCSVTTIRGDGCVLPAFVPVPWVPIHALITYRGSEGRGVSKAAVVFVRTGGANWVNNPSDSIRSVTDTSGVAALFPDALEVESLIPVIGDLIVDLPAPFGLSVTHNFLVQPIYTLTERPLYGVTVGPSLRYGLAFVDSATSVPLRGVTVEFSRRSGIQFAPESAVATSDTNGVATLAVRALAPGDAHMDVTVETPGRGSSSIVDLLLPTFDSDSLRIAGTWSVGKTGVLYRQIPGIAVR
jgi:hypothetical protein